MTGHAYRGHVFWDADLFVLPFLAATHPAAARSMLEYRLRRLPVALAAARAEGNAGARFPWESAATGCRRDADLGPRPHRPGRADPDRLRRGAHRRRHRLGRVLLRRLVGRRAVRPAAPVASCWSRPRATGRHVFVSTTTGSAHLYGVIGPDEYHEPVDDNAFTNVLARWNLRTAADWSDATSDGGVTDDERGALAITRRRARRRLRSARPACTRSSPASTGSSRCASPTWRPGVRSPPTSCSGVQRVASAQVVKQADVLMLHHLLPGEVAPGSLAPTSTTTSRAPRTAARCRPAFTRRCSRARDGPMRRWSSSGSRPPSTPTTSAGPVPEVSTSRPWAVCGRRSRSASRA